MNSQPSWDLYCSFAAVIREGSLSAAARALGITQPSVARHIEMLEQTIDAKLFVRTQRGLSPTDRAISMQPYAENLVATIAALLRTATADPDEVSGTVRLTASEMVAAEHLPPLLAQLRHSYPELAIELVATDTVDDLLLRKADIAIRMIAPAQQALLARKIGALKLGLYAHQNYLALNGMPQSLSDLRSHNLIGVDSDSNLSRSFLQALPSLEMKDFSLRVDSTLVQLAAVRSGYGIGVCQSVLAAKDPQLQPILADSFSFELPLWIVMHEDLRSNASCRAVFDALVAGLDKIF